MPLPNRRTACIGLLFAAIALIAQNAPPSADPKFDEIKAKHDRGEKITPEEQSYAQSVMQKRNQQKAALRNAEFAKQHPPRESTGQTPLTDLKGAYKGEEGGLYPGGANSPPRAHLQAGLKLANAIAPIGGKIVLLTIGMSNTTMESQAFQKLAAGETNLNPQLTIVDGAQGGQTAAITAKPDANYWTVVDQRLKDAGGTREQVQAVWLKQANAGPTAEFPAEAKKLAADILATLHNLHDKFPNLKLAHLSSRIYAGYAGTPLNPEPHAYETAFAVKWLIADQIAGKPELNYDPAKGAVRSPWIAWGPYLWTDGMKGRKDGLVWRREDVGPDGTHPSNEGREKVAKLLLDFFRTDPTAKPWFLVPANSASR